MSDLEFKFSDVTAEFARLGVGRILCKPLKANDNSKNGIYFGGVEALNLLPSKHLKRNKGRSKKAGNTEPKTILHFGLEFFWLTLGRQPTPAKSAKLIVYPQYPETRLSGFLLGTSGVPRILLNVRRSGRYLFIGQNSAKQIMALVCCLSKKDALVVDRIAETRGVFKYFSITKNAQIDLRFSKKSLLDEMQKIFSRGWHSSVRMFSNSEIKPYFASNANGTTLEAALGILPNARKDPDKNGWEFKASKRGPVTLFTSNPDGGYYEGHGVRSFIKNFGYPDKSGKAQRLNFGGIYLNGIHNPTTQLTLHVLGGEGGEIPVDGLGDVRLVTKDGQIAAAWSMDKLLEHWILKHANVFFVEYRKRGSGRAVEYRFGPKILIATGANFSRFWKALFDGVIYLDPGLKLEGVDDCDLDSVKSKTRFQFRASFRKLSNLYEHVEEIDLSQMRQEQK